ncbi:MAG: TlpA family protein disulfide reductase [Deltaproteobacteria bacterium]|nr:TlpA family protein disulfide reductase [Deltaproteobacteria bacterium]
MRLKTLLIVLVAVLLTAPFAMARMIDEKAPEFSLPDMNGKTVSLKGLRGKVVFIDFFASWCAPCKKEFPEINGIIGRYKDSEVAFVAVNVDKKRSHVEDFLSQVPNLSNRFMILLDTDSAVISSYNARAMPTSFILDKTGVIRYVHFGFRESDPVSWVEEIDRLLK